MMRRLALLLILAAGCSSALEDGYEPHKLGASSDDRRGWYEPSFAPGARDTDNQGPYTTTPSKQVGPQMQH
jgi:hypothetical protein